MQFEKQFQESIIKEKLYEEYKLNKKLEEYELIKRKKGNSEHSIKNFKTCIRRLIKQNKNDITTFVGYNESIERINSSDKSKWTKRLEIKAIQDFLRIMYPNKYKLIKEKIKNSHS